jgi:hypothetical protein
MKMLSIFDKLTKVTSLNVNNIISIINFGMVSSINITIEKNDIDFLTYLRSKLDMCDIKINDTNIIIKCNNIKEDELENTFRNIMKIIISEYKMFDDSVFGIYHKTKSNNYYTISYGELKKL